MRRIAMGAVLVLGLLLSACGGSGNDGKAGAKTPSREQFAKQVNARCEQFTKAAFAEILPTDDPGLERYYDEIDRLELRMIADLRRLRPPAELARAYRRDLDTREKVIRDDRAKIEDSFAVMRRLKARACVEWGVDGLLNGMTFVDSIDCFDVEFAAETAAKRLEREDASRREVHLGLARAIRTGVEALEEEPPAPAARVWEEVRGAMDDVGIAYREMAQARSEEALDAANDLHDRAMTRILAGTWVLGMPECAISGEMDRIFTLAGLPDEYKGT